MAISPNTILPKLLAGALAGLTMSTAAFAEAPPRPEPVSVEVSVSDLDLAKEAHARVLVDRIDDAARRVCREATPKSALSPRAVHECRRETVSRTIADLEGDRPMLAALAERAVGTK